MKKKKVAKKLSLAERIAALKEDEVDEELERLAKSYRAPTVPWQWLKQNWLARTNSNKFEAVILASREVQEQQSRAT